MSNVHYLPVRRRTTPPPLPTHHPLTPLAASLLTEAGLPQNLVENGGSCVFECVDVIRHTFRFRVLQVTTESDSVLKLYADQEFITTDPGMLRWSRNDPHWKTDIYVDGGGRSTVYGTLTLL